MRYTLFRGLAQVTNWVRLKFAAMNLKKYAIHKWNIVDHLDIFGRKLIVPEISDNGFILTFSNLDPNYSEFKRVCIF